MRSSPLYTLFLFFMSLNDNIVGTEKLDGTFSPTFIVDYFLELFLHPSIFLKQTFKICITTRWCLFRFLVVFDSD